MQRYSERAGSDGQGDSVVGLRARVGSNTDLEEAKIKRSRATIRTDIEQCLESEHKSQRLGKENSKNRPKIEKYYNKQAA